MSKRIRYHKPNARGEKISVQKFITDVGATVRLAINENEFYYKILNDREEPMLMGPEGKKIRNLNLLKVAARNALSKLGVELEIEKRNKRTSTQTN